MPQNVSIVGTITIGEETKMCSINGVGAIAPVDPGYGIPGPPYPGSPPDVKPPGKPPGIWGGPWDPPHPAHPIVLPDPPPIDPPDVPPTNPSNPSWVWGYVPGLGWRPVYVPGPGEPGPKK